MDWGISRRVSAPPFPPAPPDASGRPLPPPRSLYRARHVRAWWRKRGDARRAVCVPPPPPHTHTQKKTLADGYPPLPPPPDAPAPRKPDSMVTGICFWSAIVLACEGGQRGGGGGKRERKKTEGECAAHCPRSLFSVCATPPTPSPPSLSSATEWGTVFSSVCRGCLQSRCKTKKQNQTPPSPLAALSLSPFQFSRHWCEHFWHRMNSVAASSADRVCTSKK